jgi:hypothetical protein
VFLTVCPYCYEQLQLTDRERGRPIKCPRCASFFDADLEQSLEVPFQRGRATGTQAQWHTAAARTTRLTADHTCHQCRDPLSVPTGLRRCTILCPGCQRKTSVYALIYHCPNCRTLLESPETHAGKHAICPNCHRALVVPRDLLLRGGHEAAENHFLFRCAACTRIAESPRPDAGKHAICPYCLVVILIPFSGTSKASQLTDAALDVSEAIQRGTTMHCRHCGLERPKRAASCPMCGR